jgi:hypothetical protein
MDTVVMVYDFLESELRLKGIKEVELGGTVGIRGEGEDIRVFKSQDQWARGVVLRPCNIRKSAGYCTAIGRQGVVVGIQTISKVG